MGGTQLERPGAAQEWRRNWTVVAAAALGFAFSTVTVYTIGPFIEPLEQEFGWSRAEIASGLTLYSVLGIFLAPVVGIAIDRYGPRRIAIFGMFSYLIAFAALSLATASLLLWMLLWFFLALGSAPMKPTTWTAGVSSVLDAGRGLGISVMLCGAAIGSTVTPILATWLIDNYGWRIAYLGVVGTFALLAGPAVVLFFTSASDRRRIAGRTGEAAEKGETAEKAVSQVDAPALTGVTWREGLLSWKFVRLAGAASVATLVVVSFVSNLIPILSDQGIGRTQAAGIAGLIGVSTIVGRLSGGYLLDRVNGRIIGGISLLLPVLSVGLVLANPGSIPAATVAVLILGLSLGVELDCVAYLATRHFGLRHFGTIFGVISGMLAFTSGAGPFLVNLSYDITGGYELALKTYVPMSLFGSALFFSMGRYPVFTQKSPAEAAVKPRTEL
ncbi:MAG: MFS transporter [Sphingomonadaceae bacterium]|nr:MFS transporter [Sphingomonadaceae bacterium]